MPWAIPTWIGVSGVIFPLSLCLLLGCSVVAFVVSLGGQGKILFSPWGWVGLGQGWALHSVLSLYCHTHTFFCLCFLSSKRFFGGVRGQGDLGGTGDGWGGRGRGWGWGWLGISDGGLQRTRSCCP